jgi:hypothetical protein
MRYLHVIVVRLAHILNFVLSEGGKHGGKLENFALCGVAGWFWLGPAGG